MDKHERERERKIVRPHSLARERDSEMWSNKGNRRMYVNPLINRIYYMTLFIELIFFNPKSIVLYEQKKRL